MASTQTVSPLAHGIAVFAGVVMIIGGPSRPSRVSRASCMTNTSSSRLPRFTLLTSPYGA